MSIGERFATRNEVEQLRRKLEMTISGKNIIQPSPEVVSGPEAFVDLSDVPQTYAAAGNFAVRVKSTVDELEFAEILGTANQIAITHNAANVTISVVPQLILSDASAAPYLKLINASDTARDPIIQFAVGATPVVKYTMGVDDSYDDHLTLCTGTALVETYAAGLLVDVYADTSWIDVYPSVEVYNSLYAGDPNGNGDATYIYLASYNSSEDLLASLDISFSPNGEVDIRANNVAGGGTGQIDLMANYAGILTDGNVSGGDYIAIFANSGGLIEISTGESGDDIAWMDMESASDSLTGRAYFYFDATDYYFDGTTFNLGRGNTTTRHAQFNFINHTGVANYNYVGIEAPDAVATSFTLTLPNAAAGAKKHLLTGATNVLGWGQNVDTDGTPSFVNLGLGTTTFGASANYVLTILNGTAPGVLANCFGEYSADAGGIGGHAAPHWIGEAGGIASLECGGGTVNEYRYYADLANDAILTLPFSITSSARGFIAAGNNEERTDFWVDNDGDVTLVNNSTNVVANADTDDKLCIGTAAAQEPLQIKNRLNATKKIFIVIWYN